jgi:hypothetical protein
MNFKSNMKKKIIFPLLLSAFTFGCASAIKAATKINPSGVNVLVDSAEVTEIVYTAVHDNGWLTVAFYVPHEMDQIDIRSANGSYQNVNLFSGPYNYGSQYYVPSVFLHGSTDQYGRRCFTFDLALSQFVGSGDYFIKLRDIYGSWSEEVPITY